MNLKKWCLTGALGLVTAALLAGCGAKDNTAVPTPLSPVAPKWIQVHTTTTWQNGSGTNGQYLTLSPAVSKQLVVSVGEEGTVEAMTPQGHLIWRHRLAQHISAGACIHGHMVYIVTLEGHLIALSRFTGKVMWRAKVASSILAPAGAGDNIVVVHAHNDDVVAFDAFTGKQLWLHAGSSPALTLARDAAPVVFKNRVIAGLSNGDLIALSAKDGAVIWQRPIAIPTGSTEIQRMVDVATTPVIQDGVIYAAAFHGNVVAVRFSNGELVWEHPMSVYSNIAVADGRVVASDAAGSVWALDQQTGRTLWVQKALAARRLSGPAILNGDDVVVGDYAGYVHFLSLQDGRLLARIQVGNGTGVRSQPVVSGDGVFVMSNDGVVARLQPSR